MRILIFGGTGMLGHKLAQELSQGCDIHVAIRGAADQFLRYEWLARAAIVHGHVDVLSDRSLETLLDDIQPQALVNCIGIVKQSSLATDPLPSIAINALLPHRLYRLAQTRGIRFIHISTDCVFSGRKGQYRETDVTDAEDLYGRTKALGEVKGPGALTLRTSIIGRELKGVKGLIEWFLSQRGKTIKGYQKAIFSGLTTIELSRIIGRLLLEYPDLSGLYHVASQPIDKYSLLRLVRESYCLEIEIVPDDHFICDRSLNGKLFTEKTGIAIPPWEDMIRTMAQDPTPYDLWRQQHDT